MSESSTEESSSGLEPYHGVVPRGRLLRLLARSHKPVTLVSAPAGYGKTTLLRQWSTGMDSVLWLDPAELTDDRLLWRRAQKGLDAGDVTVIIIDDLHLLEGSRNAAELKSALRLVNEPRRLVLGTRRDPILALHEARLAGTVGEIRAHDLAFDRAEAHLFMQANDILLSTEQEDALWRHTEGWPAGMRLSATPLSRATSEEVVAALLQGDSAVGSYLMAQTLASTDETLRSFLLQTSVTEFLDAELADALTRRADSALMLECVRSEPGFLHRIGGRWPYRYHPMFRALLFAELTRSAPAEALSLSALAAAWFLEHGDQPRAAPLAVQGRAWPILAEAALTGSVLALATGDWAAADAALTRLPAEERRRQLSARLASALIRPTVGEVTDEVPTALSATGSQRSSMTALARGVADLLNAWRLVELGRPIAAPDLIQVTGDHDPRLTPECADVLRRSRRLVRAASLFVGGSAAESAAMLAIPVDPEPQRQPRLRLAELEIGVWAAIAVGDLATARGQLDRYRGIAAPIIDGLGDTRVLAAAHRWIEVETGRRPGQDPPTADQSRLPALPGSAGRALEGITDARVRLAGGDALGSAIRLDELAQANPMLRDATGAVAELWTMARVEAHLAAAEYAHALERALSFAAAARGGRRAADAGYLRVWVMQRAALDPRSGPLLVDPGELILEVPWSSPRLAQHSEALRVRVLLGAAALSRSPDSGPASYYLRLALESTRRHGWRRPYLEMASAITPVLKAERRRINPNGDLVLALLSYLREAAPDRSQLAEPLSVRELEILQYLPTALDQRELCSALFISRNTLKTHLRSTYRKLGVETRRAAVLRAEQLGIL